MQYSRGILEYKGKLHQIGNSERVKKGFLDEMTFELSHKGCIECRLIQCGWVNRKDYAE